MEVQLDGAMVKQACATLATVIALIARFPYMRDILHRKAQPHAYTWLVWVIVQGTATGLLWYGGGGGWSAMALTISTVLVATIFILSLRHGTRNITTSDTVVLALALTGILAWWPLKNPLLAVAVISFVDALGFLPTFRKCWKDPYSETLTYWTTGVFVVALLILSLAEYNMLTVTFLATVGTGNCILIALCLWRRRMLPIPKVA
jgi:hypothetical protein